ncbi:MAG: NAD(P)-binding domain-containing protein [Bacteroidota bacterium]
MKKRVAVIGAGCSGITTIKNLLQAGIDDIVCFEQNDQVGGNWIYTAGESHSSVCETTHIISSKTLSQYMDYPMPKDYPDYPSHRQVLHYFQSYAEHFGLNPYIRFNTPVKQITKQENDQWLIETEQGTKETFDYLFIANGHHSAPNHPELPGNFEGEYMHSHLYKTNEPFKGKRVLVIGGGNSACDCAVEASRVAEEVVISMRSPQYIVPKFFLGKPTDTFNKGMLWLPEFIASRLRRLSLKIQVGNYEDYGLQNPNFPVTKSHPTLNSELLYKIRHGKVQPRRGIQSIMGKTVTFTDDHQGEFDVIIAATGYKIALPFFEKDFMNFEEANRIPLYLRMFHPDHPSLIFVGFTQPQGAVWPLSDLQAKLGANYVAGNYTLPENIAQLANQEAEEISKAFLAHKRHVLEVHFHPFAKKIEKQIPKDAPLWNVEKKRVATVS